MKRAAVYLDYGVVKCLLKVSHQLCIMSKEYNKAYLSVGSLVEDMKIDVYGFGAIQNWTKLEQLLTSASHRICRVLIADFPCIAKFIVDAISRENFVENADIWLVAIKIIVAVVNAQGSRLLFTESHSTTSSSVLLSIASDLVHALSGNSNSNSSSSSSSSSTAFKFSESLLLCLFCIAKLSSAGGTEIAVAEQIQQMFVSSSISAWRLQCELLLKMYFTVHLARCDLTSCREHRTNSDDANANSSNSYNAHSNDMYSVSVLPAGGQEKVLHLLYIHTALHSTLCTLLTPQNHYFAATVPTANAQLCSVLYYFHSCIEALHAYQHDPTVLQIAIANVDYSTVDAMLTAYPVFVHYTNNEGHTWLHRCCIQDYQYYAHNHSAPIVDFKVCQSVNSSVSKSNSSTSFKAGDSGALHISTHPKSPTTLPHHTLEPQSNVSIAPKHEPFTSHTSHTVLTPQQYTTLSELTIQTLIKHNIDTNAADCTGRTALHSCTSVRTINLLCSAGADPNQADSTGITPLHQYVLSSQVECIRALLEYGADPAIAECMKGRSSVHYAAMLGRYDALYTLLRYSTHMIDLESRDGSGNTALHLCAACQTTDPSKCILLLLNQGAAVKATTSSGITALHLLCCNALLNTPHNTTSEPLVEMLLQRGANPNARDNDNCTPLIVACAYREFALCKLLLLYGGDLNIPCSMHSTFLSVGFVDHCVDIHSDSSSGSDQYSPKDHINNSSGRTDYEETESVRSNNSNPATPTSTANPTSFTTYNISSAFAYTAFYTTTNSASINGAGGNSALETITATDLLPKKPRYSVFSSINSLQSRIPCANRDRCMNCGDALNGSEGMVYSSVNNSVYGSRPSVGGDNNTSSSGKTSMYDTSVSTVNSGINSVYANISSIGAIVNNKIRSGRHHCRLCRRVVCIQCSSNKLSGGAVPAFVREQYSHEKEHRMCDICYDVLCDRFGESGGGNTYGRGGNNTPGGTSGDVDGKSTNRDGISPFKTFSFMSFYN